MPLTEEQVSRYKSLFQRILDRLREKLKREYGIDVRIVLAGSGASNMVTRNGKGGFDLDYNLVLSSIPPEYTGAPQNLKTIVRRELDATALLNIGMAILYPYGLSTILASTYFRSNIRPSRLCLLPIEHSPSFTCRRHHVSSDLNFFSRHDRRNPSKPTPISGL